MSAPVQKLFSRLFLKTESLLQQNFLRGMLGRNQSYHGTSVTFPQGDEYWTAVSDHIKDVLIRDQANFFRDPVVVHHLASQNHVLGYDIIRRLLEHPSGSDYLYKCSTPIWGSPYLLRKFPSLSPTTASHIANIVSIYDNFELGISSLLDYGGGYGGLARCMAQANKNVTVSIVDHPSMLFVQDRYLNDTCDSVETTFHESLSELSLSSIDVFNASFSFSEVPPDDRYVVEDFILSCCNAAHIIFQPSFNGVDNIAYMDLLKRRLQSQDWTARIEPYCWYEMSKSYLFVGHRNQSVRG